MADSDVSWDKFKHLLTRGVATEDSYNIHETDCVYLIPRPGAEHLQRLTHCRYRLLSQMFTDGGYTRIMHACYLHKLFIHKINQL